MSESTPPTGGALFDDAALEALLTGRGDADDPVAAALRELRAGADRPAPQPSAALAELLRAGLPIDELSRRRIRRGRFVVGIAVAGVATLTLSGVAAAHDALPGPAQGVITDIINELTPFTITPHRHAPAQPKPTDITSPASTADDHGSGRSSGDDGRSGASGSDDSRDGSGSGSGNEDGSDSGSGSGGSDDGATSGSGSDDGANSGSGSGSDSGNGSSADPSGSASSGSGSTDGDSSGSGSGSDGSDSGRDGSGSGGSGSSDSGSSGGDSGSGG